MEDKNRDESMPANPYDMRQHVEFAHAIGYTLNNDTSKELMKLMEEALKGGYKRWHYDVERNRGPLKQ
ncbi:hypothetical protein D8674_028992 [Pyrus ussuriensis x Pyrus communis]|uniref:Uncharacterized protein n=1 Tax=Pyrus ussuriensis x Pyrus communis TaxID=2448454 RepID=A0A5N5HXU0_9ROSA|nr:hypothetical protein D8674_028992 [Pyrus ussuriensis x Pyrus communis]